MAEPTALAVTQRSLLRRKRERGSYDRAVVNAILDEALVAHVGYVEEGVPHVLPMTYGRVGDVLYLHGAVGNQTLRTLVAGQPACVAVTLVDGLVFSRAAIHHSMNYRTVVLFGTARSVEDDEEKQVALRAVVDHMALGRMDDTRAPTAEELRSTLVVAFPIEEGSAKIRSGGPIEEPEDLVLPFWAGEVPMRWVADEPVPDAQLRSATSVPDYLARLLTGEAPGP
ncbi:MAG TPA: pyridoxamine 5'-phosphate oxidase family protein [Acidimicrobiales bacterium]|nr:pyridoxamine 5'-phosphate oxidase family protein [Acidimicrobiales bacterium]